jgi:DNA-binding NarL/FixJ family response regulator
MNGTIFDDCPRHSLGEPKRLAQRDRHFQSQCVYCGSPKSADLQGPACDKTQCQGKRWAEVKLSERQMLVLLGIYNGKRFTEIADEMGISTDRVEEHVAAIARKFDVTNRATLLVRCFCEHLKHQAGAPYPSKATPLKSTPRKRTSPK